MTVYDYSSGLNSINNAFANLGRQNELAYKQQNLAALGQDLSSGNYAAAAQKAIASGDAQTGIAILGLGQKAGDRDADAKLIQSLIPGGGGTTAPAQGGQRLGALGRPSIAPRGVQVAETEADAQRLEAQATGLPQLGQRSQPRGIRNANPGNIEAGPFAERQGATGSDGRFAQFSAPEEGIRAADKLLQSYNGRGLNTIAGIVGRWAPPGENNTGAYIAQVSKELGAGPDQPLDMNNPEVRQKLIAAKIRVENGSQPYAEDVFQRALNPNWQSQVASFENGQQPVQVAKAPDQINAPVSDMPAQGASQAEGFVVPGTGQVIDQQTLANNPRIRNLTLALGSARGEGAKATIKGLLDIELADAKARMDQGGPLDREGKALANEKARRDLAGEGARPMTPEERQAYSVPEGQPAYVNRQGEPKFGPASTKITNSIGATEGEYAKANGKAISGRFEKIVEEGDAAQSEAGVLSQIRSLGGQIKNMGSGAALQAKLAEYSIKVGENVSEIEAYGALIDKLTPQQKIAGAGATSDFDARMFKSSLPGLMRTPGGNEIILGTLEALNTYKRQRADVVAEAMAGNEKPADVLKRLKELPDPFAGFKESRKGSVQGASDKPAGADWQDLGGGVRIRAK